MNNIYIYIYKDDIGENLSLFLIILISMYDGESDQITLLEQNQKVRVSAFLKKSRTKRFIFYFTKYEHKGFSESIDSDNRNFSSVTHQQHFQFLYTRIFCSWSALKRSNLPFRCFDAI